ncbi:HlyD family secretion protein [Bradyrhizobium diazoefficiens]|uniref:Putative Multidrug resistance protein A n=1 Tax=Bradyrhizobium diazoefficiens SEMIA 5080 TaxID=754504 RepID=A0A837CCN8_9BRAD|nr:HlyD family secretion protein [Bradyrhizobium diazoefficiens]MBP1063127.1 membrane fusion protein (multidrug efflux system) [Bradyrhizobium japonicum]APO51148.1 hemolysin D [Bradyrhizobium diazoefficiens]KGJ67030.1 putative Multidrug resistance protein A [Bradyrhizobium diazoefficiens SEMIA 5080]KOY11462.1 hemolysin D [Bradyrhizobium diazoefficiens]MCD9298040.1 HlyD family secretion protein [Bradyrhizobium diazoefficiens]
MAVSRDQAARVLHQEAVETNSANGEPVTETSAVLAEQLRSHVAEEAKRRNEAPGKPVTDKPATPGSDAPAASGTPKSGKRKFVLMGVGLVLALAAAGYAGYYTLVGRFYIATDDAYVRANNTMLGARVAGHISSILAGDNTTVRAGDVIFRIDDGDYKIAVDAAATRIATQQATIDRIGRQIAALESQVAQAKAQLVSAEAGLKRADLDYERQQALSSKGFASRATFESSEAGRDQGAAAVKAAQAAYDVAVSNVDVTKAQQAEAQAQLAELKTSLAKAERDLAFTAVRAPVNGTFSNRLVSAGDFVAVGQRLGNVVPLDDVYIDANFKETQLKRIRPGQPVTIKVDAYGMRKFSGVVDSIAAGAGSVFTLLPPDNATGNFTKIVQRVPVRIRVPKSVAKQNLLRAGMSVYATVDTNKGAADADSEVDLDDPTMIHPQ